MTRKRFRGNQGLGSSDDRVADALGACIAQLRPLAEPNRQRVIRGIMTWMTHDAVPRVGPEFQKDPTALDRTFFRMNTPTRNLLQIFRDTPEVDGYLRQDDAGCSESCELYETEVPDDAH